MADEMKMMSYGEWCRGKQHASAAAAVNSKRNLRAFGSKNLFTKKKTGEKRTMERRVGLSAGCLSTSGRSITHSRYSTYYCYDDGKEFSAPSARSWPLCRWRGRGQGQRMSWADDVTSRFHRDPTPPHLATSGTQMPT